MPCADEDERWGVGQGRWWNDASNQVMMLMVMVVMMMVTHAGDEEVGEEARKAVVRVGGLERGTEDPCVDTEWIPKRTQRDA